jgi:hypothetical protein
MLICGQFISKDLNLWSTLLFVHFEKLNSKSSAALKKDTTFGFLTFEYALKN